jgi:quinoprotein glucose dehydrogenase
VFIGATLDHYLRAFDAKSGAELWTGRLPASAITTPMTYEWQGRQYVVVASGGRLDGAKPLADSIVAFALPREGDPGVGWVSRIIDRPGGRFTVGAVFAAMLLGLIVWAFVAWRARRARRR